MAKAIATITGTALRPGVSKNKRWYKPEHVAGAVQRAQERLAAGDKPMVMLSFHGAEDASREIAASLTGMRLAEDGSAEFEAGFTDTAAGWDIAKLADTSDGKPAHLKNVSIRGFWTGKVRKERGPDGQMAETADGLEIEGVDWTKAPGVDGAEIKTFAWAADGQNETSERVPITESVEATVTVTEETPAEVATQVPESVREALSAILGTGEVHELDNGICVTCAAVQESPTLAISKRQSGIAGTGGPYADPGYQPDKKQRYQLDTKDHTVSAWRFINKAKNAAKYTATQLKRIRGRIKAALGKFGVNISAETVGGFLIGEAVQIAPEVAEWYGDSPSRCGSWSVSASNGPVNLNLSSYSMDPADLNVILRAAAAAACDALKALDPDMDGDVDVPGADGSDTDHDGGHESAPEDPAQAAETAETDPAAAGAKEGDSAMPEDTSTTETGGDGQSGLTLAQVQETAAQAATAAVTAALEARDKAKQDKKAEKAAAATESAPPAAGTEGGTVAETQEAREKRLIAEALEAAGVKPPVAESQDEREARLIAAALKAAGVQPAVAETEDQRVERLVKEGVQEVLQVAVANGAILPGRAGIVVREHATDPDDAKDPQSLAALSDDDFQAYAGSNLDKYVGDHTRIQALHT